MCVCEEGKVTISLGLAIFPRFHHPSDMVEKGRGIISGWMGNCCMDESTRDWEPRREREVMAGEGEGIMVEGRGRLASISGSWAVLRARPWHPWQGAARGVVEANVVSSEAHQR